MKKILTASALALAASTTFAASTTLGGTLALSGNGSRAVVSRTVNFSGTTTWTNTTGNGGLVQTGSGATLANSGSFKKGRMCSPRSRG